MIKEVVVNKRGIWVQTTHNADQKFLEEFDDWCRENNYCGVSINATSPRWYCINKTNGTLPTDDDGILFKLRWQ